MRVITWNRSFKGAPNGDAAKDDYAPDDYETHATVLDKLLAWEKKLYEEVKVCCCFPIICVILHYLLHHPKGTCPLYDKMNLIHFMQFFTTLKATFLLPHQ